MSLERVHKRVLVSIGGVLGLRYASTRTVGSDFFGNSHVISFTNKGGSWEVWCQKLRLEVGFHVEGNSSSSFGGRTVLAEKNVTWETNFMAREFVV